MANSRALTKAKPGVMTVTVGRRRVPVKSFAQASSVVERYRDAGGMGGTEFYAMPGNGAIRFVGEQVAHVSYNGRVWCERCEGEIDGDPNAQFAGKACRCGHTDHANGK